MSNAARSRKKRDTRTAETESALRLLASLASLAACQDPQAAALLLALSEEEIVATQKTFQRGLRGSGHWKKVCEVTDPHMAAARKQVAKFSGRDSVATQN
jgi:hypothetical protein